MSTTQNLLGFALISCLGLIAAATAWATEIKHGDLVIQQPWSRATPPGAKVAAGYLTITNTGSAPDRLVSAKAAIAKRVEIHEMVMVESVMRMRALPDGITIAPGQTAVLKPGGNHVMFMGLTGAIKQGDRVEVTLTFEKAGDLSITLPAAKIGAMSPSGPSDAGHGNGHHHPKQ